MLTVHAGIKKMTCERRWLRLLGRCVINRVDAATGAAAATVVEKWSSWTTLLPCCNLVRRLVGNHIGQQGSDRNKSFGIRNMTSLLCRLLLGLVIISSCSQLLQAVRNNKTSSVRIQNEMSIGLSVSARWPADSHTDGPRSNGNNSCR